MCGGAVRLVEDPTRVRVQRSSVWRVAGWVVGGAGARCPAPGDTGWAGGPRVALEFGASVCGGLRVRVRAAFGDG